MRSAPLLLLAGLASTHPAFSEGQAADPGAKVFQESCLDCHKGKQSIEHLRLTRDKWKEAIERMIDSGFLDPVPPKDRIKALLEYLARTRGPEGGPQPK